MNDLDHATDERLVELAHGGDRNAFRLLYERYRDATFRFACLMLGSSEHAEDVAHDCFLGLIRNPGKFDPRRASLRTYLYAAARNLVLKRLRWWRREWSLAGSENQSSIDRKKEPIANLLDIELGEQVRKALAHLPHRQREAIVLFEYEDQSLAEIAAITGAEVGTVKWRLHEARARLRQELARYLDGGGDVCSGKTNRSK